MLCHFPSEWQPRIQTWPPGARPTADGTALLSVILEAMAWAGPLLHRQLASLSPKESGSEA